VGLQSVFAQHSCTVPGSAPQQKLLLSSTVRPGQQGSPSAPHGLHESEGSSHTRPTIQGLPLWMAHAPPLHISMPLQYSPSLHAVSAGQPVVSISLVTMSVHVPPAEHVGVVTVRVRDPDTHGVA